MTDKIGLIQIDGKIPNLALMKLSSWHKKKGDDRYWIKPQTISSTLINFDKVYISTIFKKNKEFALRLAKQFKDSEIGGSFFPAKLPHRIEHIKPDYELFKIKYSIGFTTRGCIRECPFCVVWEKEGAIRINSDIYEFWDPRHKHITLFDNNIFALPKHFKKISDQVIKEDLTVDFNQGLDVRLLDDEKAEILKQLKIKPTLRFAFDNIKIKDQVIRGIEILKKHGINRAMWYVLVGFDSTIEEDLFRLNLLKKHNQRAYVMRYETCRNIKIYNDLAAWANMQRFFMSMSFSRFQKCRNNKILMARFKKVKRKNTLYHTVSTKNKNS